MLWAYRDSDRHRFERMKVLLHRFHDRSVPDEGPKVYSLGKECAQLKTITKDNWLEVDSIISSGVFARFSMTDASVKPLTATDWVERFLTPKLSPTVPDEVRELFEVARGAMLYGVCFYPLFTLGLEQAFRLMEAAAKAKATSLGISMVNAKGRYRSYGAILADLFAKKALNKAEYEYWSNAKEFRNETTHANSQSILMPLQVVGTLTSITEAINRLFR